MLATRMEYQNRDFAFERFRFQSHSESQANRVPASRTDVYTVPLEDVTDLSASSFYSELLPIRYLKLSSYIRDK